MNTQTITRTKKYFLDSGYATKYNNGEYKSDLTFDFNKMITDNRHILYRTVKISDFSFLRSWYNINEYNNKIVINTTSFLIPQGNYDGTTFLSIANTITTGYTWSFNDTLGTYTITGTNNFILDGINSNCQFLGFKKQVYNSTLNKIILNIPANFHTIKNLYIQSNFQISNQSSRGDNITLSSVVVNAEYYGVIINLTQSKEQIFHNTSMDNIDLIILDEDGNKINFNGVDWYLTIEIDEYYNIQLNELNNIDDLTNQINNELQQ